jgi:hypothetical protein
MAITRRKFKHYRIAQTKEILKHKGTEITKKIIHNGMEIMKRKAEAQQHGNNGRKCFQHKGIKITKRKFKAQRYGINQKKILSTKG